MNVGKESPRWSSVRGSEKADLRPLGSPALGVRAACSVTVALGWLLLSAVLWAITSKVLQPSGWTFQL